jgi:hypothetical protein
MLGGLGVKKVKKFNVVYIAKKIVLEVESRGGGWSLESDSSI